MTVSWKELERKAENLKKNIPQLESGQPAERINHSIECCEWFHDFEGFVGLLRQLRTGMTQQIKDQAHWRNGILSVKVSEVLALFEEGENKGEQK